MKPFGAFRLLLNLLWAAVLWALLAGACLLVGSTSIGWPDPPTLAGRIERVLLASLVGGALGGAGVVYQAILRNPLADPYLLGVSSGASLAAYLWRLPAIATALAAVGGQTAAAISQPAFAFAGAAASVGIVLLMAGRRGRLEPLTLLLVGVIVNAFNGSIFLLVNALTRDLTAQSGGALAFLVGGIQTSLTAQQQAAAAICAGAGWLVMLYLAGWLNVAALGDAEAHALGVGVNRLRWTAMVAASLATAAVVAISGPIGFVGLVCPHLARLMVGHDVRRLLPVATALGAGLLAVADAASRYLIGAAQTLLPVGVLTGLLGGPFFLLLLFRERRRGVAEESP